VLDAVGFDVIMVETVGAGQSEVEIVETAHTVIVVEAPGLGDEVQAIKAGILEIADVFAVNKADREGADRTASALEMMLDLGHAASPQQVLHHGQLMDVAQKLPGATDAAMDGTQQHAGRTETWRPPIVKTIALRGDGVPELVQAISDHRRYLETTHELDRRNRTRLANELEHILRDELMDQLLQRIDRAQLADLMAQIAERQIDPYHAAAFLIRGSHHG
jgi:LAO/AO transport system kinase